MTRSILQRLDSLDANMAYHESSIGNMLQMMGLILHTLGIDYPSDAVWLSDDERVTEQINAVIDKLNEDKK